MDTVSESGMQEKISRIGPRFSLGKENDRVDAGRDGRTCLASPGVNGDRESEFFLFN